MEKKRESKAGWLDAPRPHLDVTSFLAKFIGYPHAPIDTNHDGYVDRAELLQGMVDCGAKDQTLCNIIIEAYFDVLDSEKKNNIRTDIFERIFTRMGQYRAISWIKDLFHMGELNMYTKTGGKSDVFFTKDEFEQAFAVQLGVPCARREIDRIFLSIDHNSSGYVDSEKLQLWYFSSPNADLRAISLRYCSFFSSYELIAFLS